MNWIALLIVAASAVMGTAAESAKPVYENDFQKTAIGAAPGDFLVLDGAFAVQQEDGQRFLELPGAPLETFGALYGPTEKDGLAVSARIYGTAKGRRFPSFGVGLNGAGGYKLQISPAKKLVELYRGDAVKTSSPLEWESGNWLRLRLALIKSPGGSWKVEGKVWKDGAEEPAKPTIVFDDKEEPPPGRPSLWGSPFSGTPIRYDDLKVTAAR